MTRKTKAQLQEELQEAQIQRDNAQLQAMQLQEELSTVDILGSNRWALIGDVYDPRSVNAFTVRNIIIRSRMAALLSPVIVAGLNVLKLFVFGQGVSIFSRDENINDYVQAFIKRNQKVFFGQRVRMRRVEELHRDGSLYIRFFCNRAGDVDLRVIDALEIQNIFCNPEDKEDVWLYVRQYSSNSESYETVAYPDVSISNALPADRARIEKEAKRHQLGFDRIDWDTPVYRIYVNPVGKWGLPSYLAALNWAKEYERFLENRATLYAAYAVFATIMKEKVDRVKAMRDAFSAQGKSPVKASTATMSTDGSIEAFNTRNATTPPAEGLQFLEMAIMVFGYPPHMFGKEESSGFGSEGRHKFFSLAIDSERTSWGEAIDAIIMYAMQCKARRQTSIDVDNLQLVKKYPPLTSKSASEMIDSIVKVATLDGKKPAGLLPPKDTMKLLAPHLGIEDITTIIDIIPDEWPVSEAEAVDFVKSIHEALSD